MLPLAAGLISALAYTLMQVLFKRGSTSASPLALTAWQATLLPFWAVGLWAGTHANLLHLTYTPQWLTYTLIWATLATITLALLIALIQKLGLMELTAYRKAATASIALMLDLTLLQTPFPPLTLLTIALITGGSIGLSHTRQTQTPLASSTCPRKVDGSAETTMFQLGHPSPIRGRVNQTSHLILSIILPVLTLATLMTLQMHAYQHALKLQPDLLSHVFAAKGLMALISSTLWLLPSVRHTPLPRHLGWLLAIFACYILGSLAEGLALQSLPVTLVIITSFAAAAIFTVHDLTTRTLPTTPKTLTLLTLIFTGLTLLAIPR